MQQFINTNDLFVTILLVVQAVLILFFVVSPIGGALIARGIAKKTDHFLMLAVMLMVFNGVFAGVTYYLQTQLDEATLTDTVASLIGVGAALFVSLPVGLWLFSHLGQYQSDLLKAERDHLDDDEFRPSTIFEEKRRERLRRKYKKRR